MLALRTLAVWLLIIALETLHGIARVMFLQPRLGDFRARQVAVFSGAILILSIVTILIRWLHPTSRRQALAIGAAWVALTVFFELSLARVMHLPWERVISDYDISHGGLMLFGLLLLFLSPLIAVRIRRISWKT